MKADEDRPPRARWLKDHMETPAAVAGALGVSPSTVRSWVAGTTPIPHLRVRELERLFGEKAPGASPAPAGYAEIVAAIDRQTAVLEQVAEALGLVLARLGGLTGQPGDGLPAGRAHEGR